MADISGYLQNIRNGARGEDVRDSIINALDKINKDNPFVIKPLNVTANGTYAGEGGIVYNPITVNVPEGASQALTLTDISITENGEYSPDEGAAYRTITVEVPQYLNEIMQEEKVLYLEEGEQTVHALADGYDGYAVVHVKSGGTGGGGGATYTVSFMDIDGTTLLQAKTNIPFGGGATYTGPTPSATGMRFVGWSPNPLNVRANMVCVPRFENLVYDFTQIQDDWVTIAKKCQENSDAYNIGQWKLLEIPRFEANYPTYDGTQTQLVTFPYAAIRMTLVAKGVDLIEGENGYANTTWLASTAMHAETGAPDAFANFSSGIDNLMSWSDSGVRHVLCTEFTENFDHNLIKYIKRVIKRTYSINSIDGQRIIQNDYPSIDWFWIPSSKEVHPYGTESVLKENAGYSYYEFSSMEEWLANGCLKRPDTLQPVVETLRTVNGWAGNTRYQTFGWNTSGAFVTANYGSVRSTAMRLGFCL